VVLVDEARAAALARGAADPDAVRLAAAVLAGELPAPGAPASARVRRAAAEFALRFQQTSGPATAKGVEDTALYRYAPLASLNEVGGEPDRPLADPVRALHRANAERLTAHPLALVAVSTHDTKRSADARARLDALAEIAPRWRRLVARWRDRHAALRGPVDGRPRRAPDAGMELMLYQTLVAVWPAGGRFALGADRADPAFAERVQGYLTKAAREAKLYTTWTTVRDEYEAGVRAFADALLAGDAGAEFRRELTTLVGRVAGAGAWTSLARTVLYAAGPGTPDVYQGDELWSLALVDPDNRRPVDWAARAELLYVAEHGNGEEAAWWRAALADAPRSAGEVKLRLLHRLLRARRADPALFTDGAYAPLAAEGARAAHVVAFARTAAAGDGGPARAIVAVAPRLVLGIARDGAPPVGDRWGDTRVALPAVAAGARWTDLVTGRPIAAAGGVVRLADLLDAAPVALLGTEVAAGAA
jgi:(1->4)-alpha-D-glucan 1-alpha-D-glucosylmutase